MLYPLHIQLYLLYMWYTTVQYVPASTVQYSMSQLVQHSQGCRETTLIGGGVFTESPEYAIFIELPEFYWML